MIIHIQSHIEHRQRDGKYTDAHLFLTNVAKAKYDSLIENRALIPVISIEGDLPLEEFNQFLGREVFFERDFKTWVKLGTGVYPEFLDKLPELPKEYETNPQRLVKILVK